tara:strand:- start:152 stop:628 length:477 start_codon:yes stop_codon:yes gene_type:complete
MPKQSKKNAKRNYKKKNNQLTLKEQKKIKKMTMKEFCQIARNKNHQFKSVKLKYLCKHILDKNDQKKKSKFLSKKIYNKRREKKFKKEGLTKKFKKIGGAPILDAWKRPNDTSNKRFKYDIPENNIYTYPQKVWNGENQIFTPNRSNPINSNLQTYHL